MYFIFFKQLCWGVIDIHNLHIYNLHELMSLDTCTSVRHNQGSRYTQHLRQFPCAPPLFVVRTFNVRSTHLLSARYSLANSGAVLCSREPELTHLVQLKLRAYSTTTPMSPSPSPWQLPSYFLPPWVWFYLHHTRGITQPLCFCDWIISLSIMSPFINVVAYCRMSSFF